jgi:uncharacterized protein (DUF1697 family)
MTRWVSLLRGINVGGNKLVKMADLAALYETLGFTRVKPYLQSGNIVFDSEAADHALIERAIAERFGFAVSVILRDAAALERTLGALPWPESPAINPSSVLILFLKQPADPAAVEAFAAAWPGTEKLVTGGAEIFVWYPDGMGTSKLTLPLLERRLGIVGTGRNLNTVRALLALLRS